MIQRLDQLCFVHELFVFLSLGNDLDGSRDLSLLVLSQVDNGGGSIAKLLVIVNFERAVLGG